MVYYAISREIEPKIVGVTNGLSQLNGSDLYNNSNQWYREILRAGFKGDNKSWLEKWVHHKDFAAKPLEGLVLEKKGKLTDYMEFNLRGFYVSNKLKSILEDAHLPPHVFQPTVITSSKTKQEIEGFYWFAFDMDTGQKTVDFEKSEFTSKMFKNDTEESFTVTSYEDFMDVFYNTGRALRATKLVFNKHFDNELDIIGTQFLSTETYISERLLKKWQEAGITGYIARAPDVVKQRAEKFNDIYTELVFD